MIVNFAPTSNSSDVRALTVALRTFAESLHEPIGLLNDLSQVRVADPDSRAVHAEFVRSMRSSSGRLVRAVALVTENPFQRALTNIHSMLVGAVPYQIHAFRSRAEAMAWLGARLESPNR